jgi:1-aminocyclopropane-1-carboxylate deaminase/D-cysteine desulfhydrase-like pyridoxal-dependent ACC family enzyme
LPESTQAEARSRSTIGSSAAYGISTDQSREAMQLAARTESIFLDPTYTAKAMAGLIARVQSAFRENETHISCRGCHRSQPPLNCQLDGGTCATTC